MQEQLSKHIAELLYHHNRLNVPGLGSFELGHAPALIDQVQGQVSAPSKTVRFNDNLVMDDGVLVDYLRTKNGWTLAETQNWLGTEVDTIKRALERREIVELAGVGRFFRNFEQQLQFVAENVNFNTDSYGLKAVNGQPIPRTAAEKIPALRAQQAVTSGLGQATATATATKPPVTKKPAKEGDLMAWLKKHMVWLLAAAAILLLLVLYFAIPRTAEAPVADPVADVPSERLNSSPSKTIPAPDEQTAEALPPDEIADENPALGETPGETIDNELDTEAPTLAPEEHSAVIAVGLFGNPDNVQRLMQKLSQQGYAPTSKREGSNTRVGVTIRFKEERELQKALREIKRDHTRSAFILSRDGKLVKD